MGVLIHLEEANEGASLVSNSSAAVEATVDPLFARVIELFGHKPQSEAIVEFSSELKDSPVVTSAGGDEVCYVFPSVGLELATWSGVFAVAYFHIEGRFQDTYRGGFLAGIVADDNREAVRKKLNVKPTTRTPPKQWRDSYGLKDFNVSFLFDETGKRMLVVSVSDKNFGKIPFVQPELH